MLRGISPLISPELLDVLYRMGHGDELVLADAHFPGESVGQRVLRADGLRVAPLLDAILPLFVLDSYVDDSPALTMERRCRATTSIPGVEAQLSGPPSTATRRDTPPIARLERFAFYERARAAYAVVMTGETAKYGNIILAKGVTPVAD